MKKKFSSKYDMKVKGQIALYGSQWLFGHQRLILPPIFMIMAASPLPLLQRSMGMGGHH